MTAKKKNRTGVYSLRFISMSAKPQTDDLSVCVIRGVPAAGT